MFHGGKLRSEEIAHLHYCLLRPPRIRVEFEKQPEDFRLADHCQAELAAEYRVRNVTTLLCLADKPGEVHSGRQNLVTELHGKIPKEWGRKPGQNSVQEHTMAIVSEGYQFGERDNILESCRWWRGFGRTR